MKLKYTRKASYPAIRSDVIFGVKKNGALGKLKIITDILFNEFICQERNKLHKI